MRIGHLTFVLAVLWFSVTAVAAQSGKPLEAVSRAAKALSAGQAAEALKAVDEAFKLGLDEELASRALLIRAQAHEMSGRPAQAMADYNGAIWMQTLPTSERKKAVDGLARVKVALGLASGGSAPERPSGSGLASAPTAAAETAPPAQSSGGGGGVFGFLDDLFGGSSSANSQPAPQTAAAPSGNWSTRVTPGQSAARDSGESGKKQAASSSQRVEAPARPERRPEKRPEPTRAEPKRPEPVRTAAAVDAAQQASGFDIDFGLAANRKAAQSQAKEIKAQLADILVSRELTLLPAGEKVRIVAGPYQSESAADALCRSMLERGVACRVTQR